MRLGISRSLGVNPARMTLSELAIHSMHSVMRMKGARIMGSKGYHRKYRHVARQHPKKWLVQDPIGCNSIERDKIFQYLQGTVCSTLKLVELCRFHV